jgi:hypothetical protein
MKKHKLPATSVQQESFLPQKLLKIASLVLRVDSSPTTRKMRHSTITKRTAPNVSREKLR